jgi:hypothetical protein
MKEYIDREALLNRLEESSDTWWKGLGRSWWAHSVILKDNFVRLIREAPTADVVEVVRCKDCEYWKDTSTDAITGYHWGECIKPLGDYRYCETAEYDFCSYGERKEQE